MRILDEPTLSGAVAGFSVHALTDAYSGRTLKLRRVSDNAQKEFGDATDPLSSIAAWYGGSSATVEELINQIGTPDLVQTTTTRQPVWNNTLQQLEFDGTDDFLRQSALGLSLTLDAGFTVLTYGRAMQKSASSRWFIFGNESAGNTPSAGSVRVGTGTWGEPRSVIVTSAVTAGVSRGTAPTQPAIGGLIYTGKRSGSTITAKLSTWYSGEAQINATDGTATDAASPQNVLNDWMIGARSTADNFSAGRLYGCIIWPTELDSTARNLALQWALALSSAPQLRLTSGGSVVTAPSISGTPAVGAQLTANVGDWLAADSYSYQWGYYDPNLDETNDIVGATAATYRPTADKLGMQIYCNVSGTNVAGTSGAQQTSLTAPVVGGDGNPLARMGVAQLGVARMGVARGGIISR